MHNLPQRGRKANSGRYKYVPPEKPCYMVPVPRDLLESFTGKLDSSLRQAYETSQLRNVELEAKLSKAIRERDAARAEVDILREQQRRAAIALGLNRG